MDYLGECLAAAANSPAPADSLYLLQKKHSNTRHLMIGDLDPLYYRFSAHCLVKCGDRRMGGGQEGRLNRNRKSGSR